MSGPDQGHVLDALSQALCERGLKAVLFGGFALPLFGVERLTLDIDFMLCDEDLAGFAEAAQTAGYREVLRTPQCAKFRHDGAGMLDIDVVFVDRPDLGRIWGKGTDHSFGRAVFRCVSFDIMLGTKLHAIRYNEANRRRDDFDDVVRLLEANGIDPAGEWFGTLCRRYGTEEIRERLCRELS